MADKRPWTPLLLMLLVGAGLARVVAAVDGAAVDDTPQAPETPQAGADLPPSLAIAEPGPLEVRLDRSGQGSVSLVLENGAGDRTVTFELLLWNGSAVVTTPPVPLTPASAKLVKLQVEGATGCPCRGLLVVGSKPPPPAPLHAAITLVPLPEAAGAAARTVWFGFGFAALLVVIGFLMVRKALNAPLASPSWEPGKSWLTNLSVVGAAFNAIFSMTALTDRLRSMTAAELLMTTTLFAALAALAPAIFDLLSAPSPVAATSGSVKGFLLAAFFTLWAAAGQLALTFVLTGDVQHAALLRSDMCLLLRVLLGALLAGVFLYALRSIGSLKGWEAAPKGERADQGPPGLSWRLL